MEDIKKRSVQRLIYSKPNRGTRRMVVLKQQVGAGMLCRANGKGGAVRAYLSILLPPCSFVLLLSLFTLFCLLCVLIPRFL